MVLNYAYLGKNFNNDEVKYFIHQKKLKNKFNIKKLSHEELIEVTSNFLIDSKIVGCFKEKWNGGLEH